MSQFLKYQNSEDPYKTYKGKGAVAIVEKSEVQKVLCKDMNQYYGSDFRAFEGMTMRIADFYFMQKISETATNSDEGGYIDLIQREYFKRQENVAYCTVFIWFIYREVFSQYLSQNKTEANKAADCLAGKPGNIWGNAWGMAKYAIGQNMPVFGMQGNVPVEGGFFYRYSASSKSSGHAGIVRRVTEDKLYTIEANAVLIKGKGGEADEEGIGLFAYDKSELVPENGWIFFKVGEQAVKCNAKVRNIAMQDYFTQYLGTGNRIVFSGYPCIEKQDIVENTEEEEREADGPPPPNDPPDITPPPPIEKKVIEERVKKCIEYNIQIPSLLNLRWYGQLQRSGDVSRTVDPLRRIPWLVADDITGHSWDRYKTDMGIKPEQRNGMALWYGDTSKNQLPTNTGFGIFKFAPENGMRKRGDNGNTMHNQLIYILDQSQPNSQRLVQDGLIVNNVELLTSEGPKQQIRGTRGNPLWNQFRNKVNVFGIHTHEGQTDRRSLKLVRGLVNSIGHVVSDFGTWGVEGRRITWHKDNPGVLNNRGTFANWYMSFINNGRLTVPESPLGIGIDYQGEAAGGKSKYGIIIPFWTQEYNLLEWFNDGDGSGDFPCVNMFTLCEIIRAKGHCPENPIVMEIFTPSKTPPIISQDFIQVTNIISGLTAMVPGLGTAVTMGIQAGIKVATLVGSAVDQFNRGDFDISKAIDFARNAAVVAEFIAPDAIKGLSKTMRESVGEDIQKFINEGRALVTTVQDYASQGGGGGAFFQRAVDGFKDYVGEGKLQAAANAIGFRSSVIEAVTKTYSSFSKINYNADLRNILESKDFKNAQKSLANFRNINMSNAFKAKLSTGTLIKSIVEEQDLFDIPLIQDLFISGGVKGSVGELKGYTTAVGAMMSNTKLGSFIGGDTSENITSRAYLIGSAFGYATENASSILGELGQEALATQYRQFIQNTSRDTKIAPFFLPPEINDDEADCYIAKMISRTEDLSLQSKVEIIHCPEGYYYDPRVNKCYSQTTKICVDTFNRRIPCYDYETGGSKEEKEKEIVTNINLPCGIVRQGDKYAFTWNGQRLLAIQDVENRWYAMYGGMYFKIDTTKCELILPPPSTKQCEECEKLVYEERNKRIENEKKVIESISNNSDKIGSNIKRIIELESALGNLIETNNFSETVLTARVQKLEKDKSDQTKLYETLNNNLKSEKQRVDSLLKIIQTIDKGENTVVIEREIKEVLKEETEKYKELESRIVELEKRTGEKVDYTKIENFINNRIKEINIPQSEKVDYSKIYQYIDNRVSNIKLPPAEKVDYTLVERIAREKTREELDKIKVLNNESVSKDTTIKTDNLITTDKGKDTIIEKEKEKEKESSEVVFTPPVEALPKCILKLDNKYFFRGTVSGEKYELKAQKAQYNGATTWIAEYNGKSYMIDLENCVLLVPPTQSTPPDYKTPPDECTDCDIAKMPSQVIEFKKTIYNPKKYPPAEPDCYDCDDCEDC